MRKIYTLLFVCLFAVAAIAQSADTAINIIKVPDAGIVLDGVADDAIWATIEQNDVTVAEGSPLIDPYFKMAWNDTALFILVEYEDGGTKNPWPQGGKSDWQSDRIEVSLDVNSFLLDTMAPNPNNYSVVDGDSIQEGPTSGHWQYTSKYGMANDSTFDYTQWPAELGMHGGYVYEGNYLTYEMIIPWTSLKDCTGTPFEAEVDAQFAAEMVITDVDGDITTSTPDADITRTFSKWQGCAEVWDNMDCAGVVTLLETYPVNVSTSEISGISIFPNPSEGVITINADFDQVVVYNAIGQEISNISNLKSQTIDLNVNSGLYIISVRNNGVELGTSYVLVK